MHLTNKIFMTILYQRNTLDNTLPSHKKSTSRCSSQRRHCSPLRWRHNDHAGVSNHQPHGCLLNRLFRRKSKKTSKLCVTGLCAGNSPGTVEFPAQMASYAENVSIWWRHHAGLPGRCRTHHCSGGGGNCWLDPVGPIQYFRCRCMLPVNTAF